MNAKDINAAIHETQLCNHEYTCVRCDEPATLVKYGAAFCCDNCAERASDFTLEDGQRRIPNYVEDLNAMHEVEGTLGKLQKENMTMFLGKLLEPHQHFLWHSTAAQRAEAFLRTIGKWKE